jgi:hypothetical protein
MFCPWREWVKGGIQHNAAVADDQQAIDDAFSLHPVVTTSISKMSGAKALTFITVLLLW